MAAKTIDVLAVLDGAAGASNEIFRLAGSQLQRDLAEARAAVAQLIAAAGPVLQGDMTTVRGRLEMTRRHRVLAAALARAGGA